MSYKWTPVPEDWETEFERIKIFADEDDDDKCENGWRCRTCGQIQRGFAPHGHRCETPEVRIHVVPG